MPRIARVTPARRKAMIYLGAGLALAGAGTASAAAGFSSTPASTAIARTDSLADAVAAASQSTHHGRLAANRARRDGSHAAHAVRHAKHDGHPGHAVGHTHHAKAAHHAKPAHHTRAAHHPRHPQVETWAAVQGIIAKQTTPGTSLRPLPSADKLTPVGTSGAQSWMPIGAAQWANTKTIVKQALARHMGLRSAVIAVATAMQESTLTNINYGTSDSLGLFQQRPSCGWGTAAQIMNPVYASDAFLHALRTYQASNPGWASQPLYQTAQGVQGSAYPYAYAKWEAQAASLVSAITKRLV